MKVLDSSTIIDLLNNRVSKELEDSLIVTEISYFEVLRGAEIRSNSKELEKTHEFFNNCKILPLTRAGTLKAAKISAELYKKGQMIEDTDCLIAGIALTNGVNIIITRDDHFSRIKELKVESY